MQMKKKKSVPLIISAVLGVLYAIYLIGYFYGAVAGTSGAEAVGGAIATALVTPHLICVILAAIFNIVAVFTNKHGFALTGAILYSVAGVLFIMYIFFVVPSLVLSFVGYAKLRKANKLQQ